MVGLRERADGEVAVPEMDRVQRQAKLHEAARLLVAAATVETLRGRVEDGERDAGLEELLHGGSHELARKAPSARFRGHGHGRDAGRAHPTAAEVLGHGQEGEAAGNLLPVPDEAEVPVPDALAVLLRLLGGDVEGLVDDAEEGGEVLLAGRCRVIHHGAR
jgi:hypothetical protein